jgi:hypothetical protein
MEQQQTSVIISVMTAEDFRTTTFDIEQVFSNKALAMHFIDKQEKASQRAIEINQTHKIVIFVKWKTTDEAGYFVTGEKVMIFKGRYYKRD